MPRRKFNKLNDVCLPRRPAIIKCKYALKKQFAEFLLVLKKNVLRCKNAVNNQMVAFINPKFKRTSYFQQNLFQQLPYEMLLMICETLPLEDLKNLACSCKYFSHVIQFYYMSKAFRRRFNIFDVSAFGCFLVKVFLDL